MIDTESQRRLAAAFRRAGQALPLAAECELMAAEIDRLRAEVDRLRALNVSLSERCHGQSELLAQRAEG